MTATPTCPSPPAPAPDPPPAELGITCPSCNGSRFKTAWQRFKDGSRHVRMSCAGCGKFIRYLSRGERGTPGQGLGEVGPLRATPGTDPPSGFRHEQRPADAKPAHLAPPPAGWVWVGFIRQGDELWRPVALAEDLGRCWDALLSYPGKGDLLCTPSAPPPGRGGERP
jgi:hypothetical protein